jgi:hypothetical protein
MSKLNSVIVKHARFVNKDVDTPYSWCYEKFGVPFKNWHATRYSNYDIYCFKYKEDYTLFLLTWSDS